MTGTLVVVAVGVLGAAVLFWPTDGDPPGVQTSLPPELVPYARTSVGVDNTPPMEVWPSLQRTRLLYLTWFASLATFSSAYRSAWVNAAVGSELGNGSAHVWGRGLDLVPRPGISRGVVVAQAIAARAAGDVSRFVDEGDHIHVEW